MPAVLRAPAQCPRSRPASLVLSHGRLPGAGAPSGNRQRPAPGLRSRQTAPARGCDSRSRAWADFAPDSSPPAGDCLAPTRTGRYSGRLRSGADRRVDPARALLVSRSPPRAVLRRALPGRSRCVPAHLPLATGIAARVDRSREPFATRRRRTVARTRRANALPAREDRSRPWGAARPGVRARLQAVPGRPRAPGPGHAFRIPTGRADRALRLDLSRCPIHRARSPSWTPRCTGPSPHGATPHWMAGEAVCSLDPDTPGPRDGPPPLALRAPGKPLLLTGPPRIQSRRPASALLFRLCRRFKPGLTGPGTSAVPKHSPVSG